MDANHQPTLRSTVVTDPAAGQLWRARRVGGLVRAAEPVLFGLPVLGLALSVYGHRLGFPGHLTGPLWAGIAAVIAVAMAVSHWGDKREQKARTQLYLRLRSAVAEFGDELIEWQLSRRGPEWLISTARRSTGRWALTYGPAELTLAEVPDPDDVPCEDR